MEQSEATSTVTEIVKDTNSPTRNRSPKSASARFRSFLGRSSNENTSNNNNNNNINNNTSNTTGTNSPPLSKAKGGSSLNITSGNTPPPPRRLSSPNLLSFLTHRREAENKSNLPSHSPTLPRKESQQEPTIPETTATVNTTSALDTTSKITPAKNAENQPATVLSTPGNTTTFVPIIDSPTPSPTLSPFHTPEHTPHSSPKPTRPPPAIPTQKKENDIRDFRKDSQDILIPRVTVDPPSTHTIYAHVDPTLSSPVHAPPRPARSATNSPALASPNVKGTDDAMMRQILASPLIGNPSPAFSSSPATDDSLLLNLTSPTVLRRPPPRSGGAGGGSSNTIFDKYNPPRPVTLLLSSPVIGGPPKSPPPPRPFLALSGGLDRSSKDLSELPETTFTEESSALTKLFLSRNHLSELPSSISFLTNLTQMDLSYNKFETLPPVEGFTKLKELLLQGNMLLQNEAGLSGIASLINLRKLDISCNQIESPNPTIPVDVFYLTSLQELHIPHNLIPSLSSDIAWLSNLTVADLSHNLFTEVPPEIGALVNLKKLNLKNNKLTTLPAELSSLVNLTELDLSRNEIQQIPGTFAALYNLMTLHLSYNQISEIPTEIFGGGDPVEADDGQMYVQGMFAIRELRLRDNLLTNIFTIPDSVYNLVDLQILDLTCNQVETLPFSSLATTTKLETLFLSGNKLQELSADICTYPSLEVLNVSDNLLTSLPELWRLDTLRQLSVSYNKLSSLPLPPPEESWKNLEEFFVAGNPDLRELSPFGELSSLRDWYLQSCGFSEVPFLHSTANLPYLEKLDLSNNSLSTLGTEFFTLETLSRFAISHNKFETIPMQLSELRRIEYLDVSHNQINVEPEPFKLMKATIGTEIITTGNPYTLTQAKPDSANGKSENFHITMADLVGRRPTMEDTFSVCPNLGKKLECEAFAIFDGHAGSIASHFVAKYLDRILRSIIAENPSEHPLKWLELTYAKLVELFRRKLQDSKVSGAKHCGTTGLILLVDSENYYVANVGDTRAVLSRGGKAIRISTDDKPSNPEEELRIRNLGGFVVVGSEISRVNGTLAVSRSIGDFYMYPFVTAEPHLLEFKREEGDQFIVLACDGVWDEQDIILGQPDDTQAAFAVRDKAYAYGSDDNISVMLLKLKQQQREQKVTQQQEEEQQQQQQQEQEQEQEQQQQEQPNQQEQEQEQPKEQLEHQEQTEQEVQQKEEQPHKQEDEQQKEEEQIKEDEQQEQKETETQQEEAQPQQDDQKQEQQTQENEEKENEAQEQTQSQEQEKEEKEDKEEKEEKPETETEVEKEKEEENNPIQGEVQQPPEETEAQE